jgi:hypothetical protein
VLQELALDVEVLTEGVDPQERRLLRDRRERRLDAPGGGAREIEPAEDAGRSVLLSRERLLEEGDAAVLGVADDDEARH